MTTINFISIHHAGGIGSNSLASSAFLTAEKVSQAHKTRWNFPSKYMKDPQGNYWYGGYNVIYDPKTRLFTQFRAIGEETAAQVGFNFNCFSLCVIGNFTTNPITKLPIDNMTQQIEEDVAGFLTDLLENNKRGLFVKPNTIINLSLSRLNPHRWYQSTECNGDFLDDKWGRRIVLNYKYKYNPLWKNLIDILISLKIITQPAAPIFMGSQFDRSCSGMVELDEVNN